MPVIPEDIIVRFDLTDTQGGRCPDCSYSLELVFTIKREKADTWKPNKFNFAYVVCPKCGFKA